MKNITKLAFLALLLISTNTILAQNTQENDSILSVELNEVVVSTPFKESVKNNVLRVSKLNLNNLNYIKRLNFSNAIQEVPGLSIISTGPGISKPVIRGLSSNRVTVFNQYMRVENQQWGDEHGMELSGFGIESVEVIKGPMSVLYGSDAIGGVLYVNPDPYYYGDGSEIELGTIYNSNYQGLTTNLGIKGGSNKLSYLVQASLIDNKNFNTPDGEVENTYFKNSDLKFGLGYTSDNFISDLRVNINDSEIGIPHGEENHDDHDDNDHDDDDHDDDDQDDHDEHEEEKSYQDLTNTMISWKNRILFDNKSEIEFTLGFSSNKRKEFGHHEEEGHDDHDEDHDDDDHDDDDQDDDHDDDHDDHDEHGEGPSLNMELETTTFDFKYIFPKSEKFELIIGANMLSQTNTNLAHEELIPDAEKNDLGVFALSHIHTSKWDILLGLRIDNRKIETSDFDQNYNSLTSSIGFKRDFAENKFFRLNISNGYRAPNLSELFSEGVHHGTNRYEIGNSTLSEEKNIQTDISLSSYGSDSSFGLDVFYNSINDYIYLNPTGTTISSRPVYNYT